MSSFAITFHGVSVLVRQDTQHKIFRATNFPPKNTTDKLRDNMILDIPQMDVPTFHDLLNTLATSENDNDLKNAFKSVVIAKVEEGSFNSNTVDFPLITKINECDAHFTIMST